MKKKTDYIIVGILLIAIIATSMYLIIGNKNDKKTQNKNEEERKINSEKFSKEYTELNDENVYTYKNADEIIKILEHGTGIVYLGFPECPWCQRYVVYLNEVAKKEDLEEIYYYNIREDRENNTKKYQKMVSILSENLQYDKEGNKRIYAPSIIAIKDGKIVGFDDETAYDTKNHATPDEYWTDDEIKDLKKKLTTMIEKVNENMCTDCNK